MPVQKALCMWTLEAGEFQKNKAAKCYDTMPGFWSVFHRTSDLEIFHSHILMCAGKCFAFSTPVYEARTLLAALDYNHHNTRPPMLTKEGNTV